VKGFNNDFFQGGTYNILKAEVAELADALGSGSSGRKAVRVQVPPSAPLTKTMQILFKNLFNPPQAD
jgi:hypothetical protein